jgi:hypothetical protein
MAQNLWDKYPKFVPSPAAMPLSGPGAAMPGAGMGIAPLAPQMPGTLPPSFGAFDPSAIAGGFGSDKLLDRAPLKGKSSADQGMPAAGRTAVVQLAGEAIRNGADPKAVRARLSQLGFGGSDFDPSDLFSDLIPRAPQKMMGEAWPAPMQARAAFDDRAGLDARGQGTSYAAASGAEMPSQFLDPGLAHQRAGSPLRLSQETGSAGDSGRTTLFTYGLPSYPTSERGISSQADGGGSAVHWAPLPNDRPLPYPSHVEGDDIVVTGPPPAAREALRQGARLVRLTPEDILNVKKVLQTEWVQRAGTDQARGIIDTILNRLASGHWGSTISAVVNQPWQFSAINGGHWSEGRHSVEEYPNSRVSRVVNDFVDAYLAERANGAPSIVGTNLNYANPTESESGNLPWVRNLDGPTFGSGRISHRHGTDPAWRRYRPGPFAIVLPRPPVPPPPRP